MTDKENSRLTGAWYDLGRVITVVKEVRDATGRRGEREAVDLRALNARLEMACGRLGILVNKE